ncbi:type II toxin-antitoxin system VapB family antitoxin [Jiella sonneratiae]|uniref:Type II toxin-antitoxin system VapB family antitoxin n=1 Tax=Jiella sonneratiae TaxID=2816856 RepID=A0ABS3IZF7_9HYPH|nr:type II toxin-antitoxin system VapB family antitoxin [Jiella sonneratiae]MBO0902787.1 type II toxin-antitoxin system VapB family antitoxin [Jiella sonneratiae]
MSPTVSDPTVDELAEEVRRATNAENTTEAIKLALRHELERLRRRGSFEERNAAVMAMADALGASDPQFDLKSFSDAMWGGR